MELIRKNKENWDPFDVFEDLQSDLNRAFTRSLSRHKGWEGLGFTPTIEVSEEDDRFEVHADLPGLRKEDLHLTVENDILTLRGERKNEKVRKGKGYEYSERAYGSFARSIQLPTEVDASKVKAAYKDGVLSVTLPKSEKAKPKQIEVSIN